MSVLDALTEGCAYGCNPVHLVTGAKMDYKRDYQNYSPYPIVIDRWYHSTMGQWRFSFERSLQFSTYNDGWMRAILKRPDGGKVFFTRVNSSAPWTAHHATLLGDFSMNDLSVTERFAYHNLAGETEYYNTSGQLTKIQNNQGLAVHYAYTAGGLLSSITDDFGRSVTISHVLNNGVHVVSQITDGDKTITYDIETKYYGAKRLHLLNGVMYDDGSLITYMYDQNLTTQQAAGLLTEIIGEDEKTQSRYQYDEYDRVNASWKGPATSGNFDAQKNRIGYSYQTSSTVVGSGTSYATIPFNSSLKKTTGTQYMCKGCAGDDATSVGYANDGAVTSRTNMDGSVTTRTYGTNAKGLPSTETLYTGTTQAHTVSYTWNVATRQPLTMIEPVQTSSGPATRTTTYTYDSNNRLTNMGVGVSDSTEVRSQQWTYNGLGQVLTHTDPVSGTTTYTYDSNHNLATKVNALGHTWTYSNYTAAGLAGRVVDPNGLYIETTYDARDRIVQVRRGHPSEHWETTSIEYNDLGLVQKITRPDGQWISYLYDDAHQVVQETHNRGKTMYERSLQGDVTKQTSYDINNVVVEREEYEYDSWRRLSKVVDAYNQSTQMSYFYGADKLNSITDIDNQGDRRHIMYDAQGRNIGMTGDLQNYGFSDFDQNGQQVRFEDPLFVSTHFQYNSWGELLSRQSRDYGLTTYQIDPQKGLTSSSTDARGVQTLNTHDALGRLLEQTYQSTGLGLAAETHEFEYDGCAFGVGRLCTVTDDTGVTSYTYDRLGRVVQKNTTLAGAAFSHSTSYAYNNKGQLVSLTYPSGRRVDYQYANGMISDIQYDFQPIVSDVTWTAGGQIKSWEHLNGTQVVIDYNLNGDIGKITDLDERIYSRTPSGRVASISDPNNALSGQIYSYAPNKSLERVELAARPSPIELGHNTNAGLEWKSVDELTWDDDTWWDYWEGWPDLTNRPGSIWEGDNDGYSMDFDLVGNLTNNKKGLTLSYDAKNRMSTSAFLGTTATYGVNALGQRMRKSGSHLSTGHRYYAYDEDSRLIGIYDGLGKAVEEYVYLDGYRVVAMARNINTMSSVPELYAVFSDHLGTPRKLTNSLGTLLWSWDGKDPYGHEAPNGFHTGTMFEFDLRFPGQIFDSETGLYHNGFRDYDPKRGAYVQPDPIGLEGGMNPYSYAYGDPVNFVDPTGLIITYGDAKSRRTVHYLKEQSATARKIITEIENDTSRILSISADPLIKDPFYENNTIIWNPEMFIKCKKTGEVTVTPELQLFHEIYHFTQDFGLTKAFHLVATSLTRWSDLVGATSFEQKWTSTAEKFLIEGAERTVRIELGLKRYRESHNINWKGAEQVVEYRRITP